MDGAELLKTEQQQQQQQQQQESSMASSRLEHVIFKDIQEAYNYDQPLRFSFKVDASFCPTAQDRIGLYTVGWRSFNDHLSFVNVQLPLDNEGSGTATLFDLPKDEEEFYQLCYIDSSSQIRGASAPFQFEVDDFEVIEDFPDVSLLDDRSGCGETKPMDATETVNTKCYDLKPEEEMISAEPMKNLNQAAMMNGAVQSNDEEIKRKNTFYPMPTWFHNPYCNYIPANITSFANARVECCEIWPRIDVLK